ncbi:MAG TPA: hypothetical protein VNL98_10100 [Gemmatimonadales bacterium]|nr:hypothetical protein [Gemmatimonadales bacterium]
MMRTHYAALFALAAAGCMLTPARFEQPSPRYTNANRVRIAVTGFEYDQFRATGAASSYGAAAGSSTVTGSGYGWQANGLSRAGAAWGSQAVQGEYVTRTLAPDVAVAFANTGCFQVVMGPNAKPDYVFEGRADGYKAMGALRVLAFVEGLTLTPLFGMPILGRAEGQASINVVRVEDGTLVGNFHSRVPLKVVTTLYTARSAEAEATATARNFAIRDAIEQAAGAFCGRPGNTLAEVH